MTFDPSGSKTVKERLRICVSAVDPKDSLSKVCLFPISANKDEIKMK